MHRLLGSNVHKVLSYVGEAGIMGAVIEVGWGRKSAWMLYLWILDTALKVL